MDCQTFLHGGICGAIKVCTGHNHISLTQGAHSCWKPRKSPVVSGSYSGFKSSLPDHDDPKETVGLSYPASAELSFHPNTTPTETPLALASNGQRTIEDLFHEPHRRQIGGKDEQDDLKCGSIIVTPIDEVLIRRSPPASDQLGRRDHSPSRRLRLSGGSRFDP